ncbi:MAG: hypothetical protein LBQ12_07990 [Deltaproteobacteria bacterium]|jgi:hypothetical protein|nr:hypothetical protein [Deltaproteobacteria bacterium]
MTRNAVLYAPSGGFRIEALFLVPISAAFAAALLSPLYAALAAFLPLVSANVALGFFYGGAAGILSGWSVTASHARSPVLAAALAALGGSAGFYLSLCGWAGALYGPSAVPEAGLREAVSVAASSFVTIAARPSSLSAMAFSGAPAPWVFMGLSPGSGWTLAVWFLQWLAFSAGICLAAARLACRPYSEDGSAWLEKARPRIRGFRLPYGADRPSGDLAQALRAGDPSYFLTAARAPVGDASLKIIILLHEKAPLAAFTVKFNPRRGSGARKSTLVKNSLAPKRIAEAIAARN